MKREQIYTFPITAPLTPTRRKIVEKHVGKLGEAAEKPVSYEWVENGEPVLRISVEPILLEIAFGQSEIKVFSTAPLWARVLFTKKRRQDFQQKIEKLLLLAKFNTAENALPRKTAKTSGAKKPAKNAGPARRKLA